MPVIYFVVLAMIGALYGRPCMAEDVAVTAARLELRPRASVTGSRVYLSDIARCFGPKSLCAEISGIDVGASPAPGRSIQLQAPQVSSVMEKEWPEVVIDMEGAEFTRVEASSVDASSDDVRSRLQELVTSRSGGISADVRVLIQRVQLLGLVAVRPTQSKIEFTDIDSIPLGNVDWVSRNMVGGRMVQVRYSNPADAEDKTQIQAQVTFAVERKLPVLRQSVAAGQMISLGDMDMTWVPMRRGNQDFALSRERVAGRTSRQSLSAGEPIPVRYVESPLAVTRNQPVTMIVRKGDLEISARATSVDQGAVGQTVEVINLATKKRMRAKIVDEKTVEAVSF